MWWLTVSLWMRFILESAAWPMAIVVPLGSVLSLMILEESNQPTSKAIPILRNLPCLHPELRAKENRSPQLLVVALGGHGEI